MWKYVSRRIRDTFERSVNHFDKRSTTGVVNASGSVSLDNSKRPPPPPPPPPCFWFAPRRCWNSQHGDNDTNSKRCNFEHVNCSWIGAITWSSALVVGWYTSQIIHLKLKYSTRERKNGCPPVHNLISALRPYAPHVNEKQVSSSRSKIEKIVASFIPTVHLTSNDHGGSKKSTVTTGDGTTSSDASGDELGDVLNSIENRLGLAAIENGQHQDGLNLLRSAANRNHAPALYNLGLCYEMGLGVAVDEKTAMELYRAAAALEHPGALYNLGIYYGQGRGGLTRDTHTATRLLRLAAVQGQKDAMNALKALDDDPTEPRPEPHLDPWTYSPYSHTDNIMLPTHSTLFVENVNYLKPDYCNATAY